MFFYIWYCSDFMFHWLYIVKFIYNFCWFILIKIVLFDKNCFIYIYIWLMILCWLFYIYVQSMLHWWVYSIYSISVDLFDCYPFFFLLLFILATMVPWKGSMKPLIYQIMHFFRHFLFENNLIFNLIRLTFLASESLKLIQKIHNSYKKVFMNIFSSIIHRIHMDPIIFLKSADISNF